MKRIAPAQPCKGTAFAPLARDQLLPDVLGGFTPKCSVDLRLHDGNRLQRRAGGKVSSLPGCIATTGRGGLALQSHHLWCILLVVKPFDPIIEVVHLHLFHFALGRRLLASARSQLASVEPGRAFAWHFWFAVVLGVWTWDRGGMEPECSCVAGHQVVLEGTVDVDGVGWQRRL